MDKFNTSFSDIRVKFTGKKFVSIYRRYVLFLKESGKEKSFIKLFFS